MYQKDIAASCGELTPKKRLDWQRDIKIKNIQINLGYQGKYYVVVAIPEINQNIFLFDSWIRQNNEIVSDSLPIDPHLALCYIKNQGRFPNEILKYFQEQLIGKILKLESLNYYPLQDQKKITLMSFET